MAEKQVTLLSFGKWLGKDVIGHNTGLRGAFEQGRRLNREHKGKGFERVWKTVGGAVGGEAMDFALPASYRNAVYNRRWKRIGYALPALGLDAINNGITVAVTGITLPFGPVSPLLALKTKVEANFIENLLLDAIGRAPLQQ